ncbi:MAG: biotin/lipoyl-containing protein, partial [Actinomycetes bacterium]
MADVQMPALGESVTEGTVTRWLKQVGDRVEVDEPLLEVSTDKVDTEIPSPVAGVVQEILVDEDETVEVGAKLAVVGDAAAGQSQGGAPADQSAEQQEEAAPPEEAQPEETEPARTSDQPQQAQQPRETEAQPAQQASSQQAGGGGGGGITTPVTMPALGESVTEGT